MTLKVGLIGCGRIAMQAHLFNLTHMPEVELIAFAEPDPLQRKKAARLVPKASAFSSYEELLERTEVQAVVICVPNALHAETTIAALNRGIHVYLEKPLATSSHQALEVIEAWQRAGVVGMMGFNYRFNKLYQTVRAHVCSGALGDLVMVRSVFSTAKKGPPKRKLSRENGGGVLLDLGSHHLDLIRYFFDHEVSEVFAEIQSRTSEGDTAMLQMRLTNGTTIQSFFSSSAIEEDSFEIYGERGRLSVNRYRSLDVRITHSTLAGFRLRQTLQSLRSLSHTPYLLKKMRAAAHEPSYDSALRRFVSAARSGEHLNPDFYDGYDNLKIIEAAEGSARTGCKMQITGRPTSFA
jgi:predicted dehydrogenase